MKLWRISQSVNNNWDTFDSAVVAAETEEEARCTYPSKYGDNDTRWNGSKWLRHLEDGRVLYGSTSCWTAPEYVSVEFLADGYEGPAGTVVASFNAG